MKKIFVFVLATFAIFHASNVNAADLMPVQDAKKYGVQQCISKVRTVSNFLLKGADGYGDDTNWNKKDANRRLLSFFISRGYSDGDSQINMNFAPNNKGGCDAVYTETFVSESRCSLVRETTFKTWKYRGSLNGKTLVLNKGFAYVYLTPAGKASNLCLMTKREVVY